MNIYCSHCRDETFLRRPKEKTIFNIQCYLCKSYFCYAWAGDKKNSKPKEIKMSESK